MWQALDLAQVPRLSSSPSIQAGAWVSANASAGRTAPSPGCLHSVLIPAVVVHTFARVFYNFTKLLSVVSYSQSGSEPYLSSARAAASVMVET